MIDYIRSRLLPNSSKSATLPPFGILLTENSSCPLSTKIHYVQMTGAKLLFLSFKSDLIDDLEVDVSSFVGVRVPVLVIKYSDAEYLQDVSTSVSANHLQLKILHSQDRIVPNDGNKLLIYMSAQPIANPALDFLVELRNHLHLMKGKNLQIIFSVGYCSSCRDTGYLRREHRCLGGGKYCTVNAAFKTNELVKETLRMICIRNNFGNNKLILYMKLLKEMFSMEVEDIWKMKKSQEKVLEKLSYKAVGMANIERKFIMKCVMESFIKRKNIYKMPIDLEMDENSLLMKEQQKYLAITKHNSFPLIILNDTIYEGNLNLQSFVKFACKRNMLNCTNFDVTKRIFAISIVMMTILIIVLIIYCCKIGLETKFQKEMKITFDTAIKKYKKVKGESLSAKEGHEIQVERLDASMNMSDCQESENSENNLQGNRERSCSDVESVISNTNERMD